MTLSRERVMESVEESRRSISAESLVILVPQLTADT